MKLIKVLVYPYSSEPMTQEIEDNIHSFMQIVEGKIDEFPIDENYRLVINRSYDPETEDFKYQKEYGIYGNFMIVKYDNDQAISMNDDDIDYVLANLKNVFRIEA